MTPSSADPPSPYATVRALLAARGVDDPCAADGTMAQILVAGCADGSDRMWEQLAEETEYHGVTPLLAPAITAASGPTRAVVPDAARWMFLTLAARHRRYTAAREACIDRLLSGFAAAKMPMVLLKGAALSHSLYPSPQLRPSVDIDILIDPADEQPAAELARALGYVFAPEHRSRFAGRWHHLPVATTLESGLAIALEIHRDAMSPDQPERLTLRNLTQPLQTISRGAGPPGLALGHGDMLRHLTRHAFEPAARVRLIHLYDLWRYQARFRHIIDWEKLASRHPHVVTALRLVDYVFAPADDEQAAAPAGIGAGMLPLSEIAESHMGLTEKMRALLDPPAWWLHGFYGVPPERSLRAARMLRHPAMVARWLARRLSARLLPPAH